MAVGLGDCLPIARRGFDGMPIETKEYVITCYIGEVGDEYQYLFSCPVFFPASRKDLIPAGIYTISVLMQYKFQQLFSVSNKIILQKLEDFFLSIVRSEM